MARWLASLLLLAAACTAASPGGSPCGSPPDFCAGNCQTETAHFETADCCDSRVCNCNPDTRQWEVIFCDPPPRPDAGPDAGRDAAPPDAGADAAPAPDATRP